MVTCVSKLSHAQEAPVDLTSLRLEELMNLDVTSAAKKSQKLSQAPTSIFVITPEEMQRSGALNIPDLLRMVPGLEVAQINPSTWAISARGFNGQYSNKLLVLIDGRTVYNPIFSGVFWDEQNITPDLIERIEVIRGPGAAIWGANAVNGVINIILKPAANTEGALVQLSSGTHQQENGEVRYGGTLGTKGAYRLHAHALRVGSFSTPDRHDGQDGWHLVDGNFRIDENYSPNDSLTVEGQANGGKEGALATAIRSLDPPVTSMVALQEHFSGWNTLARWKHTTTSGAETSLQTYFARATRSDTTTFGGGLNTIDIDFQQHAPLLSRQDFVWGVGYRLNSDHLDDFPRISFQPANVNAQIFSAFFQDEIALRPNRLFLSVGARLQHDYYNGYNFEPTTQIGWLVSEHAMVWGQASRADRMPSRDETAIRWNLAAFAGPGNLPALGSLFGNPKQKDEVLSAIQAGARTEIGTRISLDATAFFNDYRDLVSVWAGTPRLEADPQPLHLLYPLNFANGLHGTTHGAELFGHIRLASRWTLSPGYSFLAMNIPPLPGSILLANRLGEEGQNPRQQAQLRSYVNLSSHWQWSTSAYFVDRLQGPALPSYTRLDSQLAYRPTENFTFTLAGQNLLKDLHQEYGNSNETVLPSLVRRSAYIKLMWRP